MDGVGKAARMAGVGVPLSFGSLRTTPAPIPVPLAVETPVRLLDSHLHPTAFPTCRRLENRRLAAPGRRVPVAVTISQALQHPRLGTAPGLDALADVFRLQSAANFHCASGAALVIVKSKRNRTGSSELTGRETPAAGQVFPQPFDGWNTLRVLSWTAGTCQAQQHLAAPVGCEGG